VPPTPSIPLVPEGGDAESTGRRLGRLVLFLGVGLVLVALLLPNPAARSVCLTQKSPVVDGTTADVAYGTLSPSGQAALDDAREIGRDEPFVAGGGCEGLATVGRFEAPETYELLTGDPTVAVDGTVYRTRAALQRPTLGGVVLWTAIVGLGGALVGVGFVRSRGYPLDVSTAPVLPLAVVAASLVTTLPATGVRVTDALRVALAAGFAFASVALAGATWARRSGQLAILAVATVALAALATVGSGVSLLPALFPVVLLGWPVGWLGYWAGTTSTKR